MNDIHSEQSNLFLLEEMVKIKNLIHPQYANLWTNDVPPSTGIFLANQQQEWPPESDKNEINPEYKDIQVIHRFDENGYRIYPNYIPSSDKKLFCFGCSETFGYSALEEETWPYLLAKKLGNWQFKNYGIPAGGMDTITRTCHQVINSLDRKEYPDAIYILIPDPFRTDYIGNCVRDDNAKMSAIFNIQICLGAYHNINDILKKEKIQNFQDSIGGKFYSYCKYTSHVHSFFETVANFKFLQEILNPTGIQWYWYSWSMQYCKFDRKQVAEFFGENTLLDEHGLILSSRNNDIKRMKAKDNRHSGFAYHDALTDKFVKLYKS